MEQNQLDAAVESFGRAISLDPSPAVAHFVLGNALQDQGKLNAAIESYNRALALQPAYAEAHNNRGSLLQKQGRVDLAIESYREALAARWSYPEAHCNLATAFHAQDEFDSAIESCRNALAIDPNHARAHTYLGDAFKEQCKLDAAIVSYRRAIELKPDFTDAQSNMLFTMNYHPDMSAEQVFAAYREYDQRNGLPLRERWMAHDNSRDPARRLRIGYVSPDLRQHSVRHFLEPLMAHHDKAVVEVFAYAELTREDAVTQRYRGYADHWLATLGMTDDALAERIRADRIDILVDLAGHTAKHRLGVFARKPAPVSVSWMGFGCTTGLSAIDYMLTDAVAAPPGSEHLFSEKPWRLPRPPYAVFRPAEGMGAVSALPALERGFVTFGTLTRAVRINHRTIRVWAQILKRVPNGLLVVDSKNYQDAALRTSLEQKFAAHGIGPERLELGFHSPPWDVLRGLDIGLDCFPHNSGTTLFETLYMGLPFVTLADRPSVGRLGSSILQGVGHPQWIAHTEEEYVEIAVALAGDLGALAAVRAGLRAQMEASALRDELGFARKVEAAYREMFALWATGAGAAR
jgi:predicted O-linked N-acetylglucosamine transferase (SPINDLY family)